MGNQSSIYIHLDQMDGETSSRNHYKITFTSELYSECQFFKKVTYRITYYVQFPRIASSTEFYLYFRKRTWTVVNFTYYPHYESDVIEEVYCFYSTLRLDEPLVLGFKTKDGRIKYYRYMSLDFKTSTGLPSGGFNEGDILYNLQMENKKLNKKLTFYVAKGSNVHINGIPGEEDPKPNYSGRFKRVFRKANIDSDFKGHRDGPWAFYSSNLFTLNPAKNKIDDKFLKPFNNKQFYAIYVYYTFTDELAVLIELVKDFNDIIYIARRDEQGNCWERIDYRKTTETEFDNKLYFLENDFRYPWIHNRHGPCKQMEYHDPGPVDFKNCNGVAKRKPAEKPREVDVGRERPSSGRDLLPSPDVDISSPESSSSPSPSPPPEKHFPDPRQPDTRRPEDLRPSAPLSPPPDTPPTRIIKPEPVAIKIDISKTSESSYDSGNVQLSKSDYDDCALFCYFTHTLSVTDFKTISFASSGNKTIRIYNLEAAKLQSVSVYYNRDYLDKPLIMKIESSDVVRYYNDLIKSENNYIVFEDHRIGSDLCAKLIEENDKINSTNTYLINMTLTKTAPITYGHNKRIKMTVEVKDSHGYGTYTHKPSGGESFKSYVFFNKKVLFEFSDNKKTLTNIQNKSYKEIKAYFLNSDPNSPLMVGLTENKTTSYYSRKLDERGEHWEKLSLSSINDDTIKSKLIEINYPLKNSIIVEIDKNNRNKLKQSGYQMKKILNIFNSNGKYKFSKYEDAQPLLSETIKVSDSNYITDRTVRGQNLFYYVSHQLDHSGGQATNKRDIAGVRLFMTTIKNPKPDEIFFYDSEQNAKESKNAVHFYYPNKSNLNRIYAYFYHDDPRVLLISYNGIAYKRLNSDDDTKWFSAGPVSYSKFEQVLKILKSIYGTMDKKISLVNEGTIDNNIIVQKGQKMGEFIYDHYSVKFGVKKDVTTLKLPIKNLVQDMNHDNVLKNMFEALYHNSFDSISVYKTDSSISLTSILVFEFVSGKEKTHITRRDADSKYWERKQFDKEISDKVLSTLKSETFYTVIYELNNRKQYNDRIQFKEDTNLSKYGFNKFTHSIADGTYKRAIIFYEGKYLLEKSSANSFKNISESDFHLYTNVTVYFGNKVKVGANYSPLIIQLIKNTSFGYYSTYYQHKRKADQYYWERLNNQFKFTQELLSYLKRTEFDLADSTIVLINQINPKYGDTEIKNAIKQLREPKEINLGKIDDQSIQVERSQSLSCFQKNGFSVYEHDISRIRKVDKLGIRFFMFISDGNQIFSDLSLFNPEEGLADYLYFDEGYKQVSIFFYGSDSRPLLLLYGTSAYKPNSIVSYDIQWVKIRGDFDLNCTQRNNLLLNEISNVVGLLNTVNVNQFPQVYQMDTPNTNVSSAAEYPLKRYNGENFFINIGYMNLSCYRCYVLTPMVSGYRLGNISFNDRLTNMIPYQMSKQLKKVMAYFNVFDISHQYPLLVLLEFEGDSEEYYKLNDKSRMGWSLLTRDVDANLLKKLKDKEKLEEGLYEIKQDLKITFNSDSKDYLFNPDVCKEGASNTAAAIGGGVGGVVSTAAVTGGVTAAVRPEWFIPMFRALL